MLVEEIQKWIAQLLRRGKRNRFEVALCCYHPDRDTCDQSCDPCDQWCCPAEPEAVVPR